MNVIEIIFNLLKYIFNVNLSEIIKTLYKIK